MKALLSLLVVVALATPAFAEKQPVADIVRDQLYSWVPAGLGIEKIHVPASLAKGAYEPEAVTVEVPRELKAGRPSVKVTVKGKSAVFVPVSIAKLVDVAVATRAIAAGTVMTADDVAIEQRAASNASALAPAIALIGAKATHDIAQGRAIASADVALAPPLARGTQVALELHRGSVVIRGTATLEAPARPGSAASARVVSTKTVVHGVLQAPGTLVVE